MYNRYTVTVRDIMKNASTTEALQKALSTYPIYTPTSKNEYIPNIIPTREELNKKLVNHYKYREIGFETIGRFLDELEIAMCEIMPYYNQLMFTQDQDYNIIYNVDYKRTIDVDRNDDKTQTGSGSNSTTGTSSGTATGEATSKETDQGTTTTTNHDKDVKSDTPQDELSITAEDIDGVTYASEIGWHKGTGSGTNNSTKDITGNTSSETSETSSASGESSFNTTEKVTGKESSLETTKGNFGVVSAQDLVKKYRQTILNIEQMIINDNRITELFMRVY